MRVAAVVLGSVMGGLLLFLWWAALPDRSTPVEPPRSIAEPPVAKLDELLRNASHEFVAQLDPRDAMLWGALLAYGEVDQACNALPECTQDSLHVVRPIIVRAYDPMHSVAYLAVLGREVWTPIGGPYYVPALAYYVGHQSGALYRVNAENLRAPVTYRTRYSPPDWKPFEHRDVAWTQESVRDAFVREWERRTERARARWTTASAREER